VHKLLESNGDTPKMEAEINTISLTYDSYFVFFHVGDVDGVEDIESIAAATEDCIFNEFKNTEVKYKNRIRSRVANLKVHFHHSLNACLLFRM